MKIYVITKGEYSDYHICAVAVDKDRAEKLAKIYSGSRDYDDKAEVEEFDTDTGAGLLSGRIPYLVCFNSLGEVLRGFPTQFLEYADDWKPVVEFYEATSLCPSRMAVQLFAKDDATALKIACNMRAKYLAEKAGI